MMMSLLQKASKQPSTPPKSASIRLSVSSCPISLARLAPNAARTAISFSLTVMRTSNRLAMLAHVMRRTSTTVASSNHSIARYFPTTLSRSDVTAIP